MKKKQQLYDDKKDRKKKRDVETTKIVFMIIFRIELTFPWYRWSSKSFFSYLCSQTFGSSKTCPNSNSCGPLCNAYTSLRNNNNYYKNPRKNKNKSKIYRCKMIWLRMSFFPKYWTWSRDFFAQFRSKKSKLRFWSNFAFIQIRSTEKL